MKQTLSYIIKFTLFRQNHTKLRNHINIKKIYKNTLRALKIRYGKNTHYKIDTLFLWSLHWNIFGNTLEDRVYIDHRYPQKRNIIITNGYKNTFFNITEAFVVVNIGFLDRWAVSVKAFIRRDWRFFFINPRGRCWSVWTEGNGKHTEGDWLLFSNSSSLFVWHSSKRNFSAGSKTEEKYANGLVPESRKFGRFSLSSLLIFVSICVLGRIACCWFLTRLTN